MSTETDSIFSLFFAQPLVLWSFMLGVLILVTAVSLFIISNLRRKKAATNPQLPVATAPLTGSNLEETAVSHPIPPDQSEEVVVPEFVTPQAATNNDNNADEIPEFAGVEVNAKLADLFQNDIIVDPHVQALRDSLDDVSLADLVTQLRAVAGKLRTHIQPISAKVDA